MKIKELEELMLELFPDDEVVELACFEQETLSDILTWNPKGSEAVHQNLEATIP